MARAADSLRRIKTDVGWGHANPAAMYLMTPKAELKILRTTVDIPSSIYTATKLLDGDAWICVTWTTTSLKRGVLEVMLRSSKNASQTPREVWIRWIAIDENCSYRARSIVEKLKGSARGLRVGLIIPNIKFTVLITFGINKAAWISHFKYERNHVLNIDDLDSTLWSTIPRYLYSLASRPAGGIEFAYPRVMGTAGLRYSFATLQDFTAGHASPSPHLGYKSPSGDWSLMPMNF